MDRAPIVASDLPKDVVDRLERELRGESISSSRMEWAEDGWGRDHQVAVTDIHYQRIVRRVLLTMQHLGWTLVPPVPYERRGDLWVRDELGIPKALVEETEDEENPTDD